MRHHCQVTLQRKHTTRGLWPDMQEETKLRIEIGGTVRCVEVCVLDGSGGDTMG
jgi:hypothetical protein